MVTADVLDDGRVAVKGLKCPRCCGTHGSMRFTPLHRSTENYSHYAYCSVTGEPILAALTLSMDEGEQKICV